MGSLEGDIKHRHRHPHRKSRLGCLQCKRRKIKCDETRPACLNCIRREVSCAYTPPTLAANDGAPEACACKCSGCRPGAANNSPLSGCLSSSSISISAPDPPQTSLTPAGHEHDHGDNYALAGLPRIIAEQSAKLDSMSHRLASMESAMVKLARPVVVSVPPTLSYTDMDLMHHFYTSTLPSIGTDGSGPKSWSIRLHSLGSRHPHLYHLMLALAALHKARLGLHSHQRAELSVQAERHHVVGVQGSTALLESINTADYEVLHTSAILIGLINLAMGPRPGEYIAFSDQASPNFLGLLRGLRSIRYHGRRCNSSPNVPPSAGSASASRFAAPKQQQQQPPAGSPFADNTKTHVRHLYARAQKIPEAGLRRAYILALDDLEQFFILVDGPPECAGDNPPPVFDHEHRQSTFGWLYRLEDEFLERLQSKESLALVIFAYFVIIMKERETEWLASGWAEHVMPYICREVAPDVRHLVRWPLLRLSGLTQDSHFSDNTSDPGN